MQPCFLKLFQINHTSGAFTVTNFKIQCRKYSGTSAAAKISSCLSSIIPLSGEQFTPNSLGTKSLSYWWVYLLADVFPLWHHVSTDMNAPGSQPAALNDLLTTQEDLFGGSKFLMILDENRFIYIVNCCNATSIWPKSNDSKKKLEKNIWAVTCPKKPPKNKYRCKCYTVMNVLHFKFTWVYMGKKKSVNSSSRFHAFKNGNNGNKSFSPSFSCWQILMLIKENI